VKLWLAILIAASALAASILPSAAQGYYRRGNPYGYDEYGRSTDPNCYRGPNQVYVCGTRRGYGYQGDYYEQRRYRRGPSYGYDQYGRSTDPNCYRGPYGAYVC
jgi:hypothetical protein